MPDRIGEQRFLGGERRALGGVAQAGRIDLIHLKPQQVHLAHPGPFVATQLAELGPQRCGLGVGVGQLGQVDGRPSVERPTLNRCRRQRQLGTLGVDLEQPLSGRRQLAHRDEFAVAIRPAAALAEDHPSEHQFVAGFGREASLDHRLVRTGPHHRGVGPCAGKQLECTEQQRLSGAGLSGEGGHVVAQIQAGMGDNAQIGHCQLIQHGCPPS